MLAFIGSDSFGYELLVLLHVLAAIVGFGSTFVYDFQGKRAGEVMGFEALAISRAMEIPSRIITSPFIWANGLLGLGLVAMSDSNLVAFDQGWVMAAIGIYVIGLLNSEIFIKPTTKKMLALQEELGAMGPPPAGAAPAGPPPQVTQLEGLGKKMPMYSGIGHVLLTLILILMIFKPGA